MKEWIARWFGSTGEGEPGTPASAAPPPAPAPTPGLPSTQSDAAFFRWMTGARPQAAGPAAEKRILDELARLAASPGAGADLVPRVPAVIPQLLRSLRDDTLSGTELSRQLAQDVVLVAEVIREANSPFYPPSIPVKSVETGVRLLGENGLRMLLARVAFRPVISMQASRYARQAAPHLWAQAEKCALAARILAPGMRANTFEAYLAGLMQNVGLMVAFRLIDQVYGDGPLPQSDAFCAQLFAHARTLSARIGDSWDFPVTVTAAIERAGEAGAPLLAQTLALSDRVSKLRMLVDAAQVGADDAVVLGGFDADARSCFDQLRHEDNE